MGWSSQLPATLKHLSRRLAFPICLFLVTGLICLYTYLDPPTADLPPTETFTVQELSRKDVLDTRLARYYRNSDSLMTNMQLQLVMFLICIALLTSQETTTKLPVVDVSLSNRWLHIVLPILLAISWLNFGYYLHELIAGRFALYKMMAHIGGADKNSIWRLDPVLVDGAWIDAYFSVFHYHESGIKTAPTFAFYAFTAILYGCSIGLNHAFALCLPAVGYSRFATTTGWRLLYTSVGLVCAYLFVTSHFQFAYDGRNPNWISYAAASFTVFFSFAIFFSIPMRPQT
jgi:hypothetical protein